MVKSFLKSKVKSQNSKWRVIMLGLFLLFTFDLLLYSQPNTENQFSKPLKQVLNEVQKKVWSNNQVR